MSDHLGTCETTDWPHLSSDGRGTRTLHERRQSCTNWRAEVAPSRSPAVQIVDEVIKSVPTKSHMATKGRAADIWWHLWYGVWARRSALWHKVRGHNLKWRVNVDATCSGDIVCFACPNTSDGKSDLAIWCRGRWKYRLQPSKLTAWLDAERFTCPVCSYAELTKPPTNYTICPQCGVEFGNDDPELYPVIREAWEKAGRPFWLKDGSWQAELERIGS